MKKQSEEKSCTLLLDVQLNLYNLCYSLSGTDCGRVNEDTGCDILMWFNKTYNIDITINAIKLTI